MATIHNFREAVTQNRNLILAQQLMSMVEHFASEDLSIGLEPNPLDPHVVVSIKDKVTYISILQYVRDILESEALPICRMTDEAVLGLLHFRFITQFQTLIGPITKLVLV